MDRANGYLRWRFKRLTVWYKYDTCDKYMRKLDRKECLMKVYYRLFPIVLATGLLGILLDCAGANLRKAEIGSAHALMTLRLGG